MCFATIFIAIILICTHFFALKNTWPTHSVSVSIKSNSVSMCNLCLVVILFLPNHTVGKYNKNNIIENMAHLVSSFISFLGAFFSTNRQSHSHLILRSLTCFFTTFREWNWTTRKTNNVENRVYEIIVFLFVCCSFALDFYFFIFYLFEIANAELNRMPVPMKFYSIYW